MEVNYQPPRPPFPLIVGTHDQQRRDVAHPWRCHPPMIRALYHEIAVVGFTAQGKGTEVVDNYRFAELLFMNMGNIHVVRDSLKALRKVHSEEERPNYLEQVDASGWLKHLQLLLQAAEEVARTVRPPRPPLDPGP
eukprot:302874-Pyramimonas_sp.AAC.1